MSGDIQRRRRALEKKMIQIFLTDFGFFRKAALDFGAPLKKRLIIAQKATKERLKKMR